MSSQTTPPSQRRHPVHRFAGRLADALDALEPSVWAMTADELAETIAELTRGMSRLEGLQHLVVAQADVVDLGGERAATNTAAVVRDLTNLSGPTARRIVRTAAALEQHPLTQTALAAGTLVLEQAHEILRAVDALPDTVSASDRDRAESHLIGLATVHDAAELRTLGRHLLEVVDPDAADEALATQLQQQEQAAARKTYLEVHDCRDGTHHGSFKLPDLEAAMLTRHLQALLNPDRPESPDTQGRIDTHGRTRAEARGQAFCQWIRRYPLDRLPTTGGTTSTVIATIPLTTLHDTGHAGANDTGLKPGRLDSGELLSPNLARRLACEAGITPAILDPDGSVLDLGRKTRFHTPRQRTAMNLQQHGTCAVDRCTMPAAWGDAHHLVPWSQGGQTSVRDGVLICHRHHTLAHDDRYHVQRIRPGRIQLIRRT